MISRTLAVLSTAPLRPVQVLHPADRLVGQPQRGEDVVVEAVLAEQQLVDPAQELAGLGALDDPVVVGRGQRHDLGDAELGQGLLAGALELRRVLHRTDADDRALARPSAAAPSGSVPMPPGLVSEIVVPA